MFPDLPGWAVTLLMLATTVLGSGRLTRVLVYDEFPPSVWIRIQWSRITDDGPWAKLVHCWWCASFWITLICVGWWIAGTFVPWIGFAWWVFWGTLSLSYLATMIIVRDTPKE